MSGRAKRQPAAPREDESNWPRGSAASRCWLRASAAEQEGEGPVLVVGQRVSMVPGNAVDAAGHDEGAGCRAVRREVHEVRGENAVGCLVVAELVAGHGCEHAPAGTGGCRPTAGCGRTSSRGVPDRDVVQPDVRLRAAKRPEPGQCPTQRLAQFQGSATRAAPVRAARPAAAAVDCSQLTSWAGRSAPIVAKYIACSRRVVRSRSARSSPRSNATASTASGWPIDRCSPAPSS